MLVTSGSAENNHFIRRKFWRDRRQKKLVVSTIRPTQAQSIEPQNALEVCEEHLYFLRSCVIACKHRSWRFHGRHRVRFAGRSERSSDLGVRQQRLHWAPAASGLAGVIDDGIGFVMRSWAFEDPPSTAQRLSLWAAVFVGLFIHSKSPLDSVASSRCVLSHTGMCGAICFSSTNQPSIGAAL
jgi:hypothetical protein